MVNSTQTLMTGALLPQAAFEVSLKSRKTFGSKVMAGTKRIDESKSSHIALSDSKADLRPTASSYEFWL